VAAISPKHAAPRPADGHTQRQARAINRRTKNDRRSPTYPMSRRRKQSRGCHGCTACCTVLGIAKLNKKAYVDCPHLYLGGCAIYPDRPPECRQFGCLWLNGWGTDAQRPDRLGVVLRSTLRPVRATGEVELQAYEITPGALWSDEVEAISAQLGADDRLIIGHLHNMANLHRYRLMGNQAKIRKVKNG
jgi:hypothetical protein